MSTTKYLKVTVDDTVANDYVRWPKDTPREGQRAKCAYFKYIKYWNRYLFEGEIENNTRI